MREGCLDPDVIDGLLAGRLERDPLERAEAHLDACRACRELVSELARHASVATAETVTERSPVRSADTGHLRPGERVDRYVIVRRIGSGGMGVVLLAHDPELERHVVIKLLRSELVEGSPDDRDRLLREAQAMAKVSHANVVPIYDVGVHDGRVFLAMEYIDGWDLAAWLRAARRDVAAVLAVFLAAGRGLAAAHRAGLVHRDFKPHNVMIGKLGEVKVTDFGLARAQRATATAAAVAPAPAPTPREPSGELLESPLTRTGMLVGTPAYMPPEQILGEGVDARSDQFSFCVALFEALYGVRPFRGRTPEEQFEATLRGVVEVPARAGVPARVAGALERGLSVTPGARFATMEELIAELAPRRTGRRTWLAATVAGVVLAGAGGAAVLASRDQPVVAPGPTDLDPVLAAWQDARACLVGARPAVRDLTTAIAARDLVRPDGETCDAALAALRDRAARASAEAGLRAGVQDVIAAYAVHRANVDARADSPDQLPVAIAAVDGMLGRFRAPPPPALESIETIALEPIADLLDLTSEDEDDPPVETFVGERDGRLVLRTDKGATRVVTWMYDFAKVGPAGQTWSPAHIWHADTTARGRLVVGGTTLGSGGEVIAALGEGDRRAVVYESDGWYVARSVDRGRRWAKERLPVGEGEVVHAAAPLADRAELAWWAAGQLHWLSVTAGETSERVTASAKPAGTCTTGALWLLVPEGAETVVRRADREPSGRLRGAAKPLACSADRLLVTAGADDYACGTACSKLPLVPRRHARASGAAIVGGVAVRYALHPGIRLLAVWRDAAPPSYVMLGDDTVRGIVDNGNGRAMLYAVGASGEVATAPLP